MANDRWLPIPDVVDTTQPPYDGSVVGVSWSGVLAAHPGYGRWDGEAFVHPHRGHSMGTPDIWIGPIADEKWQNDPAH